MLKLFSNLLDRTMTTDLVTDNINHKINLLIETFKNDVKFFMGLAGNYEEIMIKTSEIFPHTISSPNDIFDIFKSTKIHNGSKVLLCYPTHTVFNTYVNDTLYNTTQASHEFRDVALLFHSLIHFEEDKNSFSVDGILDLILCYIKYGESDSLNFFIELYTQLMPVAISDINPPSIYQTTFSISSPLFNCFVNYMKELDIKCSQLKLNNLVDDHFKIYTENNNNGHDNQFIALYHLTDHNTRQKMRKIMSELMPSYTKIIRI